MPQHIAHNLQEKERTKDVVLEENVTFASLLLNSNIKNGLTESGYKKPSPIQFKAIPLGRCGFDLIVKSKSGTGKTLVFSTIALETVNVAKTTPQVLILVPTREIAVQIQDVLRNIGRFIEGLAVESFIGGMPLEEDIKKCKLCHVAVGAPGRVKHLITLGALTTKSVRLFVLDEADKLMETTFQNDINQIYDVLPQRKQLIAASATFPKELDTFLANYMLSPTHVTSENETPLLLGLRQFVAVLKSNTINAVQQMKAKNEILLEIFSNVSFTQCLVFTNYQSRTESVSNYLNQKGWNSSFISAAVEQSERLEAINNLKNFKSRILLSTDLTSRGIDAANVDLVINYDLPVDAVTYLHRMGRAGRYGSSGICINFALEGPEIRKLQTILGTIGSTNLSISKLPPLNGGDNLWQVDPSGLEQIWGVVPESANEVSESIKKEVLMMKQSAKTNKNNKNSKNNKKKIKLEESKEGVTEKEGSGNSKKNKKIKLEELSKENVEDFLKSKEDMELTAPGKNNKKKIKLEELGREGVESMLLGKDEEENESTTCFDTDNLLSSLIGDESDDSKKRKRGVLQEIKSEENENETNYLNPSDDISSDGILTSLLNTETPEDDSKKRKLNEPTVGDKDDKNITLSKNKGLLSVTKLLLHLNTHVDTDLVDTIDGYLTILKEKDLDDNQANTVEDILNSSTDTSVTKTEEIELKPDEIDIEDIFKTGYECAVRNEDRTWLNSLPPEHLQNFQELCRQEQITISSETDNDEDVDYEMETYEEEEEENPANDVALQWVPVEPSASSSEDHFAKCYEDCSTVLWQTGLTFETVPEFDNWYYHWQEQLQSVRNYVQQNIYVQEMSQYQQNHRLANK